MYQPATCAGNGSPGVPIRHEARRDSTEQVRSEDAARHASGGHIRRFKVTSETWTSAGRGLGGQRDLGVPVVAK